jgi:hypothetical protein
LPPNGQFAAVVHYIPQSDDSVRSRVRVVGSGLPAWESDELAYGAQLVWSTDSSMLAIGGGPVWTVVRIAPGEDTTVTSVRVAAEPAASQSPSPSGSVAPTPDSFQPGFPVPVAFSVDGRRLYGATARETPPSYGPALQVDLGGTEPTVVSIDRYPTGDSERLAPTGWPGDMIDPDTGRIAELSYNGPRPAIVILDPGAPVGEPIEVGGDVSGLMWAGDGRLLVSTNTPLDATGEAYSVDVRWIDSDGSRGPIALSAERVNGFATMATRPDYALLLFGADEQLLVVLLRTSDGATATVRLRQEDFMDLVAIDLVDPLALR